MMLREQEARLRSTASRQKKRMRTKRRTSRKCRNMQITVTARTAVRVIYLQMEQKVPVRMQQIREVAQQRL